MRKTKFPNTYVIIFSVIMLCAVATWFVPGGRYNAESPNGVPVYEKIESVPQTWQVFEALYNGFEKQAGIIAFILIIGGVFWIVNASGAMNVGIKAFLSKALALEKYAFFRKVGVRNVIMVAIVLLFSLFGGVFGMSEETIAFVVITVPLAISMGYDSIVGVLLLYVAAHIGFAGAFLNPFTIGVAQGMAELPMFSGMGYRIFCWAVLTLLLIVFLIVYAARIAKDPKRSIMYEADAYWREKGSNDDGKVEYVRNKSSVVAFIMTFAAILLFTVFCSADCTVSIGNSLHSVPWLLPVAAVLFVGFSIPALRKSYHFFVLVLLCFTIVYLVIGVLCFGWYIPEITALFLALAILSGIAAGMSPNKIVEEFLSGAKDIFSAALIVGLASGIIIILQDGMILDTILYSLASGLGDAGKTTSLTLMYGIQTVLNLFIPSATAKAAITMPIMAPFSDLIGLSRQATVLAFQFGDGFTNMITPTSGVLMAVLGMARIPYAKWVKWAWKFILALIVVGFLLLLPTIFLPIEGF